MPVTRKRGPVSNEQKRIRAKYVVIMWIDEYMTTELVSSLHYSGPDIPYNASTRVYEKDCYDVRAGENLPYFDYELDALEYMRDNKGDGCQVSLNAAHKIWPNERFIYDGKVLV